MGWHPVFLKSIGDLIAAPLAKLFQKSLEEGYVPAEWRMACITAIHKKDAKDNCGNYRPVSITSIICKLMESIVRDQILQHMVTKNLFSKRQHGFVPNRNCMTNLLMCMEMWTQLVEEGYQSISSTLTSLKHLTRYPSTVIDQDESYGYSR